MHSSMSKARSKFGQDTIHGNKENQILVPRHKFQFDLKINYGAGTNAGVLDTKETASSKNLRISSVDLPAHSFNVATFNAYNRKRLVQTGVTYAPITLVAYDTVDGTIEKFLQLYSNYYYGDGTMTVVDEKFKGGDFTSTSSQDNKPGFRAPAKINGIGDERYFITEFVITRSTSPEDKNEFTLFNPLITNINADKLAYAESGLIEYQIQLQYEGYHVDNSYYTAKNAAGETILDNIEYNPNESTGPSLPVPKNSAGETFIDTWKYDNPDESIGTEAGIIDAAGAGSLDNFLWDNPNDPNIVI
jgi:hypothetical protein